VILGDTVSLALRNLRQAKLRTGLTTLGVSIGIASLTGMVSLGIGLQEQFVGRFTQSGLFDTITVLPGQVNVLGFVAGGGRGRGRGPGRGGGRAVPPADSGSSANDKSRPDLDDQAIAAIAALPDVREAYPNIRVPVQAEYGTYSEITPAAGVLPSARTESAFQSLPYGSFFTADADHECMLSLDAAKSIIGDQPGDLVGKTLTLSYATTAGGVAAGQTMSVAGFQLNKVTRPCRVVGIVERQSGAGLLGGGLPNLMLSQSVAMSIESAIVTGPQALFRSTSAKRTYTSVTVKTRAAQATQDVEARVKALGFSAVSINDALQGAKRAFILLDIVLSLIGSIALTVSSLGIVNTMVMSILERTREIGVMKAIGGSDADIRTIFLVEASAIGVLGGAVGIALGWVVGRAINFGANIYIQNQGGTAGNLFSLPLWLIGGAMAFSWLVSLLAGSYPATRAARLDPIQALRHD
jgi:putative ABC transport system permease protein